MRSPIATVASCIAIAGLLGGCSSVPASRIARDWPVEAASVEKLPQDVRTSLNGLVVAMEQFDKSLRAFCVPPDPTPIPILPIPIKSIPKGAIDPGLVDRAARDFVAINNALLEGLVVPRPPCTPK